MASELIKRNGNKITLQVEIELDPASMPKSEQQIEQALNEAGTQAAQIALEQFDTDGSPICVNGQNLTSKGQIKKNTRHHTVKQVSSAMFTKVAKAGRRIARSK